MSFLRVLLAVITLTAFAAPAFAQDAAEMAMRINRLEDQVRQLTGQNEEYAHQIKLLQQQVQQLGGTPVGMASAAPPPVGQQPPQMGARPPVAGGPPAGTRPTPSPVTQIGWADPNVPAPGPQNLGTLPSGPTTGPVTGTPGPLNSNEPGAPLVIAPDFQQTPQSGDAPPGVDTGPQLPPGVGAPEPGAAMATATPTGSAEEEYALGAGFLQRKDYEFAQTQFQSFIKQFPDDARIPDALYGLGESFYQRGQHNDAIEPFLEVVTKHAQSPRAADSMLRLGQTLGEIDQKEQACATLLELGNKYPRSNAKAQSVKEMQKLGC
jgi:tol-pal system protein YbgF